MNKQILVPRTEDKAAAELEGIFPEPMLPVSGAFGARPGFRVVTAKEMEQVSGFQFRGSEGNPFLVNQQRKRDVGFLAKQARIVPVAQPDRCQAGPQLLEFAFACAQLRDVLAAKDSAVVPQKDHNGGTLLPKRTEPDFAAARVGQDDVRESGAESRSHD
jgi:hypothetical protein